MTSFRVRSYQKELLDSNDIPFADIKRNMEELEIINSYLGGHDITINGLKQFTQPNDKPLHVVEIGCGGGDNLRALKKRAIQKGHQLNLSGIDINPDCIQFARSQEENDGISFTCSDYRDARFDEKPNIIFSSLFCHHFNNEELIWMLQWMQNNSSNGFFINDLHRHPLAFYSIKLLTGLFSKSYLVKNDAPLSVLRGFTRKEWEDLFHAARISNFKCTWKWAFRWLITYHHELR